MPKDDTPEPTPRGDRNAAILSRRAEATVAGKPAPLEFLIPNEESLKTTAEQIAARAAKGDKLNPDWPDRVLAYLESNWKHPCPYCGDGTWLILDSLMADSFWSIGKIYLLVGVVCLTCGNTVHVNANLAGVFVDVEATEQNE